MKALAPYIPNLLTLLRLLLVVPVGLSILGGFYGAALGLFLLAAISDLVDGWLARRYAWESSFGRLLDPVADKLLLVTVLVTLTVKGVLPLWACILFLGRDLVLLIAAGIYRYVIGYLTPAPTFFGKSCVAAIMVLTVVLLLTQFEVWLLSSFSTWFVGLGAVLIVATVSIGSLVEYLWTYCSRAIAVLRSRREQS